MGANGTVGRKHRDSEAADCDGYPLSESGKNHRVIHAEQFSECHQSNTAASVGKCITSRKHASVKADY